MAQHTNTSKNFETFIPHFETFANLGYYKLMTPTSKTKEILHYYYRILVWFIFIIYNVQHVLRVIEVSLFFKLTFFNIDKVA